MKVSLRRWSCLIGLSCLLSVPLAHAQSGNPASGPSTGAWTFNADAAEWGETPTNVRTLITKLQNLPDRKGPDPFDVVWLRELLRHPNAYHLSTDDENWMHRTILAADQAHQTHWQPTSAPTVTPVLTTAASTPVVVASSPSASSVPVPSPIVSAPRVEPVAPVTMPVRPATEATLRHDLTASAVKPVATVPNAPAAVASASDVIVPEISAPERSFDTVWAMVVAAVLVSALVGVGLSLRPSKRV